MAEKKKVINVRLVKGKGKRKARAKPKEKSRQKQKQRQTVNVQVSSGGSGGGGTSFIPMPQAPAFDYSLLASLIRPANTVDMPIRAMSAIPEPVQTREAEAQTIAESIAESRVPSGPPISKGGFPVPTGFPSRSKQAMSESSGVESGFITSDTERVVKAPRADKGKSRGSYKEKQINIGRNVQNLFALGASTSGFASGGEDEPPRFQAMTGGGRFGEK